MKESSQIDVAVLLIFFNRPEKFKEVFAQVQKAKPSKLFLYQDGARHSGDIEGIEACRSIASEIDWECEVHQLYQEKNYGCDPSEFIAQRWAFSFVDKCIVIEDDDVPSLAFFHFCKSMLDKYENDPRVWMIAGFNAEEKTEDISQDYFFTSVFSIWGWASWRRVIDQWDEHYTFLDNKETLTLLTNLVKERNVRNDFLTMCHRHKQTGKAHYETIFWASMLLNNGLAIMPTFNLVNNIGVTSDSTHFTGSTNTLPKGIRKMFTMQRFEPKSFDNHPQYIIEHTAYKDRIYRMNAWNNPAIKVKYSLEELWLNLQRGNFSIIKNALSKRIKKWLKMG